MISAPPPSPMLTGKAYSDFNSGTTTSFPFSNTITSNTENMHYNISLRVPNGTRIVYEKWCSPEFFNEIIKGFPRFKGNTISNIIDPKFLWVFEKLEEIYADKLWEALKKRGKSGTLHFNFNRHDFERTGLGPPLMVCNMFLNELTKEGANTFCKHSNGKFHGMQFNVWGNGAFTTHFWW